MTTLRALLDRGFCSVGGGVRGGSRTLPGGVMSDAMNVHQTVRIGIMGVVCLCRDGMITKGHVVGPSWSCSHK